MTIKQKLHIPDLGRQGKYGNVTHGLCGQQIEIGIWAHQFGSIRHGQVNCVVCINMHVPHAHDTVFVTGDTLALVAHKTNSRQSMLRAMLDQPLRYSALRMVYDDYRGADGEGPARGWLLTHEWAEGVSEEEKEKIRTAWERRWSIPWP
jgi:hypothetical protein